MTRPPAPSAEVMALAERLNVSRESWQRIALFTDLLFRWQEKINLVSPASLPDVWMRHVIDSLQLLDHMPEGAKVFADLGSGSGFPALPLAIASGLDAELYESNTKKGAFLMEALRQCGAKGRVHMVRLGDAKTRHVPAKVQLVTARALAPLGSLIELALPFLAQGAPALFLKGQDVDAELTLAAKSWKIDFRKHPSLTDPRSVVLEVREVSRV